MAYYLRLPSRTPIDCAPVRVEVGRELEVLILHQPVEVVYRTEGVTLAVSEAHIKTQPQGARVAIGSGVEPLRLLEPARCGDYRAGIEGSTEGAGRPSTSAPTFSICLSNSEPIRRSAQEPTSPPMISAPSLRNASQEP